MRAPLILALLASSGCQLYFGDDGGGPGGYDEPLCEPGYYPPDPYYGDGFRRNLDTGYCQGLRCDSCGNCEGTEPAPSNWPLCDSHCDALDEETCLVTQHCQAAYWEIAAGQNTPTVTSFRGCYFAQDGGFMPGACAELGSTFGAFACNLHEECALFYTPHDSTPSEGEPAQFARCATEPQNVCKSVNCDAGQHCESQCTPPTDCLGEPTDADCTPTCTPMCVPDVPLTPCEMLTDQATCDSRSDCTSVFVGEDCTCYPGGSCECQVLTWDRCEAL